jgi:hypothetical protein
MHWGAPGDAWECCCATNYTNLTNFKGCQDNRDSSNSGNSWLAFPLFGAVHQCPAELMLRNHV